MCRNAPVGHHSEDLVPASVGQLHRGERKLHLFLHSRQRLFDQPLPGSYEPILRAVLGVPNQLSGPIPSELEGLTNLAFLYLDGNSFIGCIPSVLQDVEDNDLDQLELAYCS